MLLIKKNTGFLHFRSNFDSGRNPGHDIYFFNKGDLTSLLRTRWVPTERGIYFIINLFGQRLKLWKNRCPI